MCLTDLLTFCGVLVCRFSVCCFFNISCLAFFLAFLIFAIKCQNFSHISSRVLSRMTMLLENSCFYNDAVLRIFLFLFYGHNDFLCLICNPALFFSCLRMRSVDVHCFSLYLLLWAVSFALLVSCRLTLFGFYGILMRFQRPRLAFFRCCLSVSRLALVF